MNTEIPKELNKWHATRQKGMRRFILVTGVISWGIPMFVVMTFVPLIRSENVLSLIDLFTSAIVWLLAGAFFGGTMWFIMEKRYQKHLTTQARDDNTNNL